LPKSHKKSSSAAKPAVGKIATKVAGLQTFLSGLVAIPSAKESLICVGACDEKKLPAKDLKVLVWNVYKGKHPRWAKDFCDVVKGHDLVLLQEAVTDDKMPQIWKNHFPTYAWNMAASFNINPEHATGVAIGSRVQPTSLQFVRSTGRELFLLTPKIALISTFEIHGHKQSLLVVNTHSLNFTTTAHFVKSIEEKVEEIRHHVGPVIFAGDFNTWNPRRWMALVQMLAALHLHPIEFENDSRFFKLDHIFVRGCKVHKTEILDGFKGSDHVPLEMIVSFE
jgi:endonuclease/exonuclease/phosphatase (EEP) superfamily protein YafD